jgi:hypothetical protein
MFITEKHKALLLIFLILYYVAFLYDLRYLYIILLLIFFFFILLYVTFLFFLLFYIILCLLLYIYFKFLLKKGQLPL